MQANWPTTGAVGAVDVGVVVVELVVDVVVVDDVEVVVVDVGGVVDDVVVVDVGGVVDDVVVVDVDVLLDVGAGAPVSSTESLVGEDDSVRVVHPAAIATMRSTDITFEYR